MIIETNNYSYFINKAFNKEPMVLHPELCEVIKKSKDEPNTEKIISPDYYEKKFNYLKEKLFFNVKKEDLNRTLTSLEVENLFNDVSHIAFEVTEDCNLKCYYCTFNNIYNQRNETIHGENNMNIDVVIKSLNLILNKQVNKTKTINISFYGGEPLLNMKLIIDTVAFCKTIETAYLSFKYSLTTNAILLKKHIDFFQENSFNLLISLDGDYESNSYRVTKSGGDSSKIIEDNLKYISNKYPLYFKKNISFNSVLHNRNSIAKTSEYIFTKYGKITSISELAETKSIEINKIKVDYSDDYFKNETAINKSITYSPYQSVLINLAQKCNKIIDSVISIENEHESSKIPTGTCLPFSKKIYITTKGDILPCERVSYKYAFGNINDKYLDFDKIASFYNLNYEKYSKFCQKCYRKSFCSFCFLAHGDLTENKCPEYMTETTANIFLSKVYSYYESNLQEIKLIWEELDIE